MEDIAKEVAVLQTKLQNSETTKDLMKEIAVLQAKVQGNDLMKEIAVLQAKIQAKDATHDILALQAKMKIMEEKLTTTEQVIQLKTEDIENLKAKLEAAEKGADQIRTTQIKALQNKVKHLKLYI